MKRYDLVGQDGNAWSVMGYVTRAMKDAYREVRENDTLAGEETFSTFGKEAQSAYTKDATSGDYNHLLCVSMDMLDKVNEYFASQGYEFEDDDDDDYYDEDEDDWEDE